MRFVRVARVADVPDDESRVFELDGASLAVFNAGSGRFHACRNRCPHRDGPVGEGDFDGKLITCPWHGWQFDVGSGVNPLMPAAKLEMFEVRVVDGYLEVGLP